MLEVVNPSDIKHAYRFSENLKNNIYYAINQCNDSQIFESTDKNNNPISIIRLYDEDDDLPDGEEVTLLFDYYHALCATQGILYQRISKMFLPIVDENEDIMEYISDEAMCGETFDESFGAFLYQNGGI